LRFWPPLSVPTCARLIASGIEMEDRVGRCRCRDHRAPPFGPHPDYVAQSARVRFAPPCPRMRPDQAERSWRRPRPSQTRAAPERESTGTPEYSHELARTCARGR
jgi:hypothetical protein